MLCITSCSVSKVTTTASSGLERGVRAIIETHIEFSGIKFALIQAAEFGGVLTASAVIATLFLAGWTGPFLSGTLGPLWFLLKLAFFAIMFVWVRATFPRLRIDQIMAFAWKFLLPLSVLNLFAIALEIYFLRDDAGVLSRGDLGVMAGINLGLLVAALGAYGSIIRERVRPRGRLTEMTPGAPLTTSLQGYRETEVA